MDFTAIDLETANHDLSSICQIGVVQFKDGSVANNWKSYIDPRDYFDGLHIGIHGIDEKQVAGAPIIPDIYDLLCEFLTSSVVVTHGAFDRRAIESAFEKNNLEIPNVDWLDNTLVIRRAWKEYARAGYGLAKITDVLGIDFQHHDAEEDARATGEVLLHAIEKTGLTATDWLVRTKKPISPRKPNGATGSSSSRTYMHDGNPEGPLYGEVMAFTGSLSIVRQDAAAMAGEAGCKVTGSVTNKTTLLVVGDMDVKRKDNNSKSRKYRKAEEMIKAGEPIRILRETDFRLMLEAVGIV